MALSDLSFKFYTDSGLTTAFTNLYQLNFKSDLSNAEQDLGPLYFGSNEISHTLQTQSSPGTNQITLTPSIISAEWEVDTAYASGYLLIPTTPNGFIYKSDGGTSAAVTEPTWPTSVGSTVVDNDITWTCYAPTHPASEIKLALSSGGLPGATGGAALNIGTTLNSGVANAVAVYIRITNTITQINNNTGYPQLGLVINAVQEAG